MENKEYSLKLDHLEIYFSWKNIIQEKYKIVYNINETNTPIAHLDYVDRNWEKFKISYLINTPSNYSIWYSFLISINDISSTLFNVSYWNWRTKNKITIYSTFLAYFWEDYVFDFIMDFFDINFLDWVKRFDLALDLPEDKSKVIETFLKAPSSTIGYDKDKKSYETYYFWKRENWSVFLRIYDKKKDTIKKWKSHLFDFWWAEDITRFELEFWRNFLNWVNREIEQITFWWLLLDDKLKNSLFFSYIMNYTNYFWVDFHKVYKMKKAIPKVQNLEKYYFDYEDLPKWHKSRIKWARKYIDLIWLEKFLDYAFDGIDWAKAFDIYSRFIDSLSSRIKFKIRKKIKDINSKELFKYKDKIDFLNAIIDSLLKEDLNLSNLVFSELKYTFDKINNDLWNIDFESLEKNYKKYLNLIYKNFWEEWFIKINENFLNDFKTQKMTEKTQTLNKVSSILWNEKLSEEFLFELWIFTDNFLDRNQK